jgi:site-specific recombinase XerD
LLVDQIETWKQELTRNTGLDFLSIDQYVNDARRFAAWSSGQSRASAAGEVMPQDAKDYRNYLVDEGRAPSTINRALVSLSLFMDAMGREGKANPFRRVDRVEVVERPPRALTRNEWNTVRRMAEALAERDQGLALALACLMRYAGPRVGEVAALQLKDVQLGARRGVLVIRRGKGLKHREVPLVLEAREPLQAYLRYREKLDGRWAQKALARAQRPPAWAAWPDGHLFLGQRGPLTERGIREIVAKLGVAAKLEEPLSPHDLRHTMAKALLDPAAYGIDRPPAPITAVQELLGHADIATTAIYTRATHADLARIMGDVSE